MKSLSIVIPVYNVEQYVARCIDSCVNQDIAKDDYEIIVVDDGTPDDSVSIVQGFQKLYPNIKLIHRANGGLSAARNSGLDAAEGEYVWFVDSDDHIEPNCTKMLVEQAERNKLDVLCFNLKIEYPTGEMRDFNISCKDVGKVYTGQEFIVSVGMPPAAWVALYRREFLLKNRLRFYEGIVHEDQEFTPRAYCLAERISYVNNPVYYYYQREGSIMKSGRSAKRCKDLLIVADSLYAFANAYLTESSVAYDSIMKRVYFCVTQSLAYYSKNAMALYEYKCRPYYPMNAAILSGKMKIKVLIANTSLRIYLWIHKIMGK